MSIYKRNPQNFAPKDVCAVFDRCLQHMTETQYYILINCYTKKSMSYLRVVASTLDDMDSGDSEIYMDYFNQHYNANKTFVNHQIHDLVLNLTKEILQSNINYNINPNKHYLPPNQCTFEIVPVYSKVTQILQKQFLHMNIPNNEYVFSHKLFVFTMAYLLFFLHQINHESVHLKMSLFQSFVNNCSLKINGWSKWFTVKLKEVAQVQSLNESEMQKNIINSQFVPLIPYIMGVCGNIARNNDEPDKMLNNKLYYTVYYCKVNKKIK